MPVIGLLLGQMPEARTTRLLSDLLHRAAPPGTTIVELTTADLPHHSPCADAPATAASLEWKRALSLIDGLLVVTPSHERSIPGLLKHALDWASASPCSLAGVPAVIAGAAAPRAGRFSAVSHLRTVLADAGASVMGQPERSLEVTGRDFDADGRCVNVTLWEQARELLGDAAGHVAHQSRLRGAAEAPTAPVPSDPVRAVRAEASPAPASPVDGVPAAFLDTVATADPLTQPFEPIVPAPHTATGAPAA